MTPFGDDTNLGKRLLFVIFIMGFIFFLLFLRLLYLQVWEGDRYRSLADKNRISVRLTPPLRGGIFDYLNIPIAKNKQVHRCVIIPQQVSNIDSTVEKLKPIFNLNEEEENHIKKTYKKLGFRSTTPIILKKNLDQKIILKIELSYLEDQGVHIYEGFSREYPFDFSLSHVLGYIGHLSQKDKSYETLSRLGSVYVGKTGVEKIFDEDLFGMPGAEEIEVNAAGQSIRKLSNSPSKKGEDLKITINSMWQKKAYDLLAEHKSGSIIVMNAKTGAIHALVSYPGYDPHIFEEGISKENWETLLEDIYRPLNNKATSGLYAPGSTLKMIVALAALEAGVPKTEEHFCSGSIMLGDHTFHCHKKGGHGTLDMVGALRESCDVYFYEVAQKIGIDKIAHMASRFGLGSKTLLDFPSEKAGLVPSKSWKMEKKKESWKMFDTILSSIGQGYFLSTPLQLAQMTARLATGKEITPHLIEKESPIFLPLNILPQDLDLIQEGMQQVMNHPRGSAFWLKSEGLTAAGKTGTSQVKRISMKERKRGNYQSEDLQWKERDHAVFVGYAPFENPEFVAVVLIEHGGWGSRIAAPIGVEILKMCLTP